MLPHSGGPTFGEADTKSCTEVSVDSLGVSSITSLKLSSLSSNTPSEISFPPSKWSCSCAAAGENEQVSCESYGAESDAEEAEMQLLADGATLAILLFCLKGCLDCPDIIASAADVDGQQILDDT